MMDYDFQTEVIKVIDFGFVLPCIPYFGKSQPSVRHSVAIRLIHMDTGSTNFQPHE
jgi:hypothetical protein